eukprot:TRINITY_DN3746_c0_g1_i1.p1 TRINITY_DN3746_c0_g1~~TRINITY_DN3746_c0_g1_i1.p1  ORF type:complete len:348 (+),score=89.09 TRINITY_DN3746_c0_g1_i1:98-1141(+)
MGERKVLNKYYPPDFDFSKLRKGKKKGGGQQTIRAMAPYSMRCIACGNYINKGTKFNTRKETVIGEDYYGIKIFRFYIKCTRCSNEITFKTDPKNSDYEQEHGAIRTIDGMKLGQKIMAEFKKERTQKEEGDVMKTLENRTLDQKMELDILDNLEEIRSLNSKTSKMDPMEILDMREQQWMKQDAKRKAQQEKQKELNADPDELAAIEEMKKANLQKTLRRLEDEEEETPDPHSRLFRPFKKKEVKQDADGFQIPPTRTLKNKVKDSALTSITIQGRGSRTKIRGKFRPSFRKTTLTVPPSETDNAEEKGSSGSDDVVMNGSGSLLGGSFGGDDDDGESGMGGLVSY